MNPSTKVQISDLVGPALDWAVAKCEGESLAPQCWHLYGYSSSWEKTGRLIERFEIDLKSIGDGVWQASNVFDDLAFRHFIGPTPIVAALRCVVAMRLGEEVEVPDELVKDTAITA